MCILASPAAASYSYQRRLTIDHTKVSNTDQVNFPVLVSITDAAFKTTGAGGHVENASGYDVGFYSSSTCTTPLSFELQKYDGAAGTLRAWVKVPAVSHTSDSAFYVCYGDAGISTSQATPTAVWDANYKAVYHLENGTALSAADSASGGFGTGTVSSGTAATAKLDGGASFTGTGSINLGNGSNHLTQATIEAWLKPNSIAVGNQIVAGKGYQYGGGGVNAIEYELSINRSTGGKAEFLSYNGSFHGVTGSTASLTAGQWVHLAGTFDGTAWKLYINGALDSSASDSTHPTNSAPWAIGADITADIGTVEYLNGVIDEVRISNVARGADWIATQFNNHNSPATFLTLGAEQAAPVTFSPAKFHNLVVF